MKKLELKLIFDSKSNNLTSIVWQSLLSQWSKERPFDWNNIVGWELKSGNSNTLGNGEGNKANLILHTSRGKGSTKTRTVPNAAF